MNTTAKGDAFENTAFNIINELLHSDELPVNGKYCKVYRKKKYYSEKRKSDIIIDISVECTLPNEEKPCMYLMIECKDYSKAIPVDDIEEFYAKVQQITGLNTKAIFMTTNVLQEAALNFAMSSGIRVIMMKEGKRNILSFRKEGNNVINRSKEIANAILDLTSEARAMISNTSTVGLSSEGVYYCLADMLMAALNSDK